MEEQVVWSLAASGLLAGHLLILWVYPVRKEHCLVMKAIRTGAQSLNSGTGEVAFGFLL